MKLLSGQVWRIATGAAAVIALAMMALLMSSYFTNRELTQQRDVLANRINDPKSGYVAQLAQARTNVEQLKVAVAVQNAAYDKLSAESAARLAESKRQLAAAQAETKVIERKLAGFLATKPQGSTLEERVRDIDRRALTEFVP